MVMFLIFILLLFIVESIAMTNAFYNNPVALDAELNPEITGSHAVMTGKVASQWFRTAYLRPTIKPIKNGKDAPVNRNRQSLDLRKRFRIDSNRHVHIIKYRQILSTRS